MTDLIQCPTCLGSGQRIGRQYYSDCTACQGAGLVPTREYNHRMMGAQSASGRWPLSPDASQRNTSHTCAACGEPWPHKDGACKIGGGGRE